MARRGNGGKRGLSGENVEWHGIEYEMREGMKKDDGREIIRMWERVGKRIGKIESLEKLKIWN